MRWPALLGLAVVLLCLPAQAGASHGRYYHYTWSDAGGNAVDFQLNEGWRRGSLDCVDVSSGSPLYADCTGPGGGPGVGDIVQSDSTLDYGDDSAGTVFLLVTAISLQDDSLTGIALDPASFPARDSSIRHEYPQAGNFLASSQTCCRIGGLSNSPLSSTFRTETLVQPGSGNDAPVSALPPVVRCPAGGTCSFLVPASDPNGDDLAFRFATGAEAAGGGDYSQPAGASIDGASGLYTFDTSDQNPGQLWTSQVAIEDLDGGQKAKSKVVVDFIIRTVDPTGSPPQFDAVTPCGQQVVATPGQQMTFSVGASDADLDDAVELNSSGLPAGATMTPQLPVTSNPVSSSFSWTPEGANTGSHVVTFTATDKGGQQTLCSVEVLVNPIQIGDASVDPEGGSASFPISLQAPSDAPVSVDFATASGSAASGSDFEARQGTITLAPGTTAATIQVSTTADSLPEPDETFTVELSGAQGAPLGDGSGLGTILDDEAASVALSPRSAERLRGETQEFGAAVRATSGRPLAGKSVRHSVEGANPGAGEGTTDGSGTRTFAVTGTQAGEDTIRAYADANANGVQDAGEPGDAVTARWTAPAGEAPPEDSPFPGHIETAADNDHLSDPEPFREMNVQVISGVVSAKPAPTSTGAPIGVGGIARASQAGKRGFIRFTGAAQLPVGTIVDTDAGRVRIEAAANASGTATNTSDFFEGTFRITQPRSAAAFSEMIMEGGTFFRTCRASKGTRRGKVRSSQRRRGSRRVRHLWGDGRGKFRTRGSYSSATIRGTRWRVEDRCDGTRTTVRSGRVLVEDLVGGRKVTVRAGESYLVRASSAARR